MYVLFNDEEEKSKWSSNQGVQTHYDPQENLLAILLRWSGTVTPLVVYKQMFWLLLSFHFGLLVLNEHYYNLPAMDLSILLGLPASLLIFLVVFYNGNCYERFFELWRHTCEINAIVNQWIIQVAFTMEEIDARDDGVIDGKGTFKNGLLDVDEATWNAARRILSAMQMLFMSLDCSISDEDRDWIGRPVRLPNIMLGDGLDDEEYKILKRQGLLTDTEIRYIKQYPGFKCQVPIKWALLELREACMPNNRMNNESKNYEAMQEIATSFNTTAITMVTLMQQPVPFMYFHILKLMMLIVNGLIAYEMVNIFADISWSLSLFTYAIIAATMIGLLEIAGAMSDPFGTDPTDFDTHTVCFDAYKNAVAYLAARPPSGLGADKPTKNPIKDLHAAELRASAAAAATQLRHLPEPVGLPPPQAAYGLEQAMGV